MLFQDRMGGLRFFQDKGGGLGCYFRIEWEVWDFFRIKGLACYFRVKKEVWVFFRIKLEIWDVSRDKIGSLGCYFMIKREVQDTNWTKVLDLGMPSEDKIRMSLRF